MRRRRRFGGRRAAAGLLLLAAMTLAGAAWAQQGTLHVWRISPSGTDVQPGQEVVIQFDRAVVPLGNMARKSATLAVSIEPDPGCQWRWLDTSELACRLPGQHRFAPATQYTVTVGTGLKALDGTRLGAPVVATFTTWRPKIEWAQLLKWTSPVTPVFEVALNIPVTARELAAHIGYVDDDGHWTGVKVAPFTKKRTGPIWLPMPGLPGAMLVVSHPTPTTPRDVRAAKGAGRSVWKLVPAKPLAPAASYRLTVKPGLHSPLGPLASTQHKSMRSVQTYGPFTFRGVACRGPDHKGRVARPGQANAAPCVPGTVSLLFGGASVPRATPAAAQWQPLPLPKDKLAAFWRNYSRWVFRCPGYLRDERPEWGFHLGFPLRAMHTYTVTIPAGVRDCFGRALAKPESVTFHTGHYRPALRLASMAPVLEAGEPTMVPLTFVNLDKLTLRYQRMWAPDVAGLHAHTKPRAENLLARPDLAGGKDQVVRGALGIRELLKGRSGIVWGEIARAPTWQRVEPIRVQAEVTPWQVLAKVGHYNTLVRVVSLKTGRPVAGAAVKLVYGPRHELDHLQAIGHALTTNASGLVSLPGTVAFPDTWSPWAWNRSADFYVAVTRGKDLALLPLDGASMRQTGEASQWAFSSSVAPVNGHLRAWAVTGQGIYKPGSDVKYALFVRREGEHTLRSAPQIDYTLSIMGPKRNTIEKRQHVKLSAYGEVHGSLRLPATAANGVYRLELSWPTATGNISRQAGTFIVTDFTPAALSVHLSVPGTLLGPADKVTENVAATLHAGGPYGGAAVKFETRLSARPFAPDTPATAGFVFGDDSVVTAGTAWFGTVKDLLDASGRTQQTVTLPAKSRPVYGTVRVVASVESARATWVTQRAQVPYAARDRFVGLRTQDWVQTQDKPFRVQYLVVDPFGNPRAGSRVSLQLQRHADADASDGGSQKAEAEWVGEDHCKAISATAPGACELTPQHSGRYRVLATVVDTQGRTQRSVLHTWVIGGATARPQSNGNITLVPDQSSYHVGDVAKVLVQNPYPGAKALLTVERFGVLWKKVVTLQGPSPVITVPIQHDFFPGAFLSVAIFSPRTAPPADPDKGKPALALGYMQLKVKGKGPSLDVAVTPRKSTYKPRQTVHVKVAVRKRDGAAPGKTRLVVAVVDQGVLDLLRKGRAYYDPRTRFYAPPSGPDVVTYSLARRLVTDLQAKQRLVRAGEPPPPPPPPSPPAVGESSTLAVMPPKVAPPALAGEQMHIKVRELFRHSVYWNARLETDASGHAQFHFRLPDNLTRWRILVIAMRPGNAMGLGDGNVRVNLPLQITSALPNQMHVGDHFGAAFNVTNRTGSKLSVSTHIQAHGAIQGGKADSRGKLDLASFAHGLSWLPLTASAPGDITLTAAAQAGNLGDAVRARIPVRRAGTRVVAAEYGSLAGTLARVPVKVPARALAGSSGVTVTFAPTLVGGLTGAFRALREDPLHTWEVRLSRAVLAADYLRLKPVLGNAFRWPEAAKSINTMLNSAQAYQAPDGGMAFWVPRDRFVSPYLSVYTALAFDWLDQAGHAPPAKVRARLRGYLHKEILGHTPEPVLRAGALAALAMSPPGKLPTGAVTAMLPKLHELRLFGQALLLEAALGSHDRASADTVVKSLLSYAEESAGSITFNDREQSAYVDLLATPLRSNCAILDALSRYHGAYGDKNLLGAVPEKLMRWVAGQRRNAGGWPNSQENVFCATAITHFADAYETPVRALQATLHLPGEKPQHAAFTSRAAPAVKLHGPTVKPGQSFHVQFGRSGKGRLYYDVQVHYAMAPDALPAADAGMTVSRHYFVQRGNTWQPVTDDIVLHRDDIVRVDLDINTPTERHHVVLMDPLPGAFEAVNRQLATSLLTTPANQPGVTILHFDGGAWPNMAIVAGGFYHRETGFDAVRFFADDLPAGHYRIVYAAQVFVPGTFIAPAPIIKEIYQPDVFGRGTPQHLQVAMPKR